MQKVEGVQTVAVSLKEGTTTLELRDGNNVTVAKLRSVIKNNGFVSKEIQVIARGAVRADGFVVSGTNERLQTVSAPVGVAGEKWKVIVPPR